VVGYSHRMNDTNSDPTPFPRYRAIFSRGLRRRCPKCGIGRVFNGYLTVRDQCPHCNESFDGIRTDDAAPWATILVVGHLIVPSIVLGIQTDYSTTQLVTAFSALVVVATLAVLPLMKGLLFGLNWRLGIRYP
jgi:uncharacterized protein (DUF983 family)